jgi:phosphoglycerate dehydrogenase-like enzyme
VATICVPDSATAAVLADLVAADPDLTVVTWGRDAPPPAGVEDVEFYVPAYAARLTRPADIARMPRLKVIQVLSAGVDGWLDLVPPGAMLCNGTGIHGASTAELALAGILSHLRRLPQYAEAQLRGEWKRIETRGLRGQHLLVLGAGDIGGRIAEAAKIFEAEVTLVARSPRAGVRSMADVPGLLPSVDILVVALPGTPETNGLIDADLLAALPDGALVVNISRGSVLVTDALLSELTARRLFAFLDVVDTEPLPAGHPLWSAPNVVITPHVGGGTDGWAEAAARLIHDQVGRFRRGEPLENVVQDGY